MQQSRVPMAGHSSAVTWECDQPAHRCGNAADNGTRQPHRPGHSLVPHQRLRLLSASQATAERANLKPRQPALTS